MSLHWNNNCFFVFRTQIRLILWDIWTVFQGLIQTGAWTIFYNFDFVQLNVVSVVAQQISLIQRAIAKRSTKILFEDTSLKLNVTCNILLTINSDYTSEYTKRFLFWVFETNHGDCFLLLYFRTNWTSTKLEAIIQMLCNISTELYNDMPIVLMFCWFSPVSSVGKENSASLSV